MAQKIINTKQDEGIEVHVNDSGTTKKNAKFDSDGGIIIGSESNDADNVKIHRAGSSTIQFVTGDDATNEGVTSPNFATVVFNPADLQQGGTVFTTTQAGHGFTALDAIYHDGSNWVKAQANSSETVATYMVIAISGDDFTAQNYGRINFPGHGLTVGEYYFCSTTVAGDITATAPLFGYSNPVLYVEDTSTLHIAVERSSLIGDGTVSDSEIGSVMAFATDIAPVGFLPCEGQAISRNTYADLYLVIGNRYGNGDGASTFNLPDLRGRFVRGWDNSAGNDPDAGSRTALYGGASGDAVGSYQNDATTLPNSNFTTGNQSANHQHISAIWCGNTTGNYGNDGTTTGQYINTAGTSTAYKTYTSTESADHSHTVNGGGDNETRPVNVNVAFYIRYLPKGALRGEDLGEIGDIKHSMLTVPQFQTAHGIGWILMDGSSVVGSKYETITGNSTVPDARGQFLRGKDHGAGVDQGGDRALGNIQSDATAVNGLANVGVGNHTHVSSAKSVTGTTNCAYGGSLAAENGSSTGGAGAHNHSMTGDSETRPTNIAVNIFIKVN